MKETIYSYFKHQVDMNPDVVAVLDKKSSLTFSKLDALVNTIASGFEVEGQRQHLIGVVMNHGVEQIASMLAILKMGAGYVPVEPFFPEDRIKFIMNECHVDFVITNKVYKEKLSGLNLHFVASGLMPDNKSPLLSSLSDTRPDTIEDNSSPEGVAYVLYTSGSTGMPKGVMVENRNVCHYIKAFENEFHVKPGDKMLQYSVCSFDIFVEEVFTTLCNGATLAIPSDYVKGDIHRVMDFIEEHQITEISGFPYLLLKMNKLSHIPSSLRLLISGGDVLREDYVTNILDKFEIYNTYGPSEGTVCASYCHVNKVMAEPDGTYPIGLPVLGTQIEIRNEKLEKVPTGTIGEICIFGGGVSRGYIGEHRKKENEAYVELKDGRRMYRSGDLGLMRPDGTIIFLHRKDTQVMILGKRVETMEVQNILCNCPDVEKGVVMANNDENGLAYLTAYIVPKDKLAFRMSLIREQMAKFLPAYMIPEFFIKLEAMPLTLNGKVDTKALPMILKAA
ncbi:MAG: amino acid adenylation domain-containing protein [Paludibacteraceae bacterium]|jgi:D-alanine--poly(phosphoribitol) ligase subunit 1|nr:amino acid adenylation domain-containing protein [Paludibacteraceae bacterium]